MADYIGNYIVIWDSHLERRAVTPDTELTPYLDSLTDALFSPFDAAPFLSLKIRLK